MKKLFKFGCLSIIILVALVVIAGMFSGGGSETTTTDSKPKQEAKQPAKKVSKVNYDKITQGDALTGEGGMSIDQVKAILGDPDTKTEAQSGDMKMEDMTWTDGLLGSSISVNFINGKVAGKFWLE